MVFIQMIFFTDSWEKNWVYSEHPGKEFGKFVLSHGKFWNDRENDKGKQNDIYTSHVILKILFHTSILTQS